MTRDEELSAIETAISQGIKYHRITEAETIAHNNMLLDRMFNRTGREAMGEAINGSHQANRNRNQSRGKLNAKRN